MSRRQLELFHELVTTGDYSDYDNNRHFYMQLGCTGLTKKADGAEEWALAARTEASDQAFSIGFGFQGGGSQALPGSRLVALGDPQPALFPFHHAQRRPPVIDGEDFQRQAIEIETQP